jgi:hypothetical protein
MRYQILLSHAEEDNTIAESLARLLQERGITVYYDKFSEVEKWGKNNIDFINDIFGNQGKYCIVLLSKHYANNNLANLQRQISQNKSLSQKDEYILPIRFDDTKIDTLLDNIGCIKYYEKNEVEIANIICEKLGIESPVKKDESIFRSGTVGERIIFEMESSEDFGGFFTMHTYSVNNSKNRPLMA